MTRKGDAGHARHDKKKPGCYGPAYEGPLEGVAEDPASRGWSEGEASPFTNICYITPSTRKGVIKDRFRVMRDGPFLFITR